MNLAMSSSSLTTLQTHSLSATLLTMTSTAAAFLTPQPARTLAPKHKLDVSIFDNEVDTTFIEKELNKHLIETKSLRSTLNVYDSNLPITRPLIVGHRGCLYEELENTRESFLRTAEMGADAVELDVFLLKCGTLVVFHGSGTDENPGLLEQYTIDKQGSILEYSYDELSDLTFNHNFDEFGCHPTKIRSAKIPTLEQVLRDAKDTGILVKIELKGAGTAIPVLELVENLDMQHQCHYSSFDLDQIAIIRKLRPQRHEDGTHVYKTGALFDSVSHDNDYLQLAQQVGASEVHLRYDLCSKERIRDVHAAGMDSMAWFRGPMGMNYDSTHKFWDVGNEDVEMYQAVLQSGVRQMCVNRPNVLVEMFER